MKKLHVGGFSESYDFESFDACKHFLKENDLNPFIVQKVERTIYLLEIIHADVCDPSSVIVCGRFFYFIKLPSEN